MRAVLTGEGDVAPGLGVLGNEGEFVVEGTLLVKRASTPLDEALAGCDCSA